jgi:hypothetical protein
MVTHDFRSDVDPDRPGRPIPDAANSIAELCTQIGQAVTLLTSGAVVGIKPVPQLWPAWEIELRIKGTP